MVKKYYEKYLNIPVAARAAMWFVICSLLQKTITFITTPIFTRIMSSEEYGLYSTYLSVYSIVVVICTLSMEKCIYINNVAKAETEEEKNSAAVPLLSLSFVITVIVFCVYWIFKVFFNNLVGLPTSLMCLMFIHALCEPPIAFFSVKQRFDFKYITMVSLTIGMVISNTLLGIILVCNTQNDKTIARVLSIVIVQVIFAVALYIYFWSKGHKVFSVNGWKRVLNVQLPLLPHSLSLIVLSSSDRIMINTLIGATQAAIYSVAYSAGYVVGTLKNNIVSALTPWIYQKIKEKNFNSIRNISKTLLLLIMFMTFAFIAFAPELVKIMAPPSYYEAIYVIPPVAASSFFTFLYSMFSSVSFYFEKTKSIMSASIIGAISNVVLNWLFIPVFGYVAAGYTTLACYIFFTIAHYHIMRKICDRELGGIRIFDLRNVILLSVIVLVMCVFFSIIYPYTIVRYIVLVIVLLVMLWKKDIFIESMRLIKKRK